MNNDEVGRREAWVSRRAFTRHEDQTEHPIRPGIPIVPELHRIIDVSPVRHRAFLVSDLGKPSTSNGFGNTFREWRDAAGLKHPRSAHGLREAAAARLTGQGR